jgi:shikimate kinase
MSRLYLIGYMGCGKSTIGKRLAKEKRWAWLDTDRFIENRFRKSISDIFSEYGEEKFREIEHKILLEVSEYENVVISTGGGMPCFYNNMEIMNATGTTIYLKLDEKTLFSRLKHTKNERISIKNLDDDSERNLAPEVNVHLTPAYTLATCL